MTKLSDKLLQVWLVKAEADLESCVRELRHPDGPVPETVCFHAQQMAEKCLKAFLHANGAAAARTHDIEHLAEECAAIDSSFGGLETEGLSEYAVEARCPEGFLFPEEEDACLAFETASAIRDLVYSKLDVTDENILRWKRELKEKA